jgi:hypothetical protein
MPSPVTWRGRRAATIENAHLRVTVVEGGGHIAEIGDKASGVNPLWTPPWESIDPVAFDRTRHHAYGDGADAPLLAGILGHNLCLDIFGGPSAEEAAAGLPVHGEASHVTYEIDVAGTALAMRADLPKAGLVLERTIELHDRAVRIRETVANPGGTDKPVAWTQHVTLGPPFLERGVTAFNASAARSRVIETVFGTSDYLVAGADFDWPLAPRTGGGHADLRRYTDAPASSAYTAHLMDPAREHAFFVACSPAARLAFGYVWRRQDFPWMGIWEENHSRSHAPWNRRTMTRGMEFGVSPFPETRRQMVERGRLFDTSTFRWIPAASRVSVEYWCVSQTAAVAPETLAWPG